MTLKISLTSTTLNGAQNNKYKTRGTKMKNMIKKLSVVLLMLALSMSLSAKSKKTITKKIKKGAKATEQTVQYPKSIVTLSPAAAEIKLRGYRHRNGHPQPLHLRKIPRPRLHVRVRALHRTGRRRHRHRFLISPVMADSDRPSPHPGP